MHVATPLTNPWLKIEGFHCWEEKQSSLYDYAMTSQWPEMLTWFRYLYLLHAPSLEQTKLNALLQIKYEA